MVVSGRMTERAMIVMAACGEQVEIDDAALLAAAMDG